MIIASMWIWVGFVAGVIFMSIFSLKSSSREKQSALSDKAYKELQ